MEKEKEKEKKGDTYINTHTCTERKRKNGK